MIIRCLIISGVVKNRYFTTLPKAITKNSFNYYINKEAISKFKHKFIEMNSNLLKKIKTLYIGLMKLQNECK